MIAFRILSTILLALAMSSCTLIFKNNGGEKIASFEDRSVVYGWIDMTESGDRLDGAALEQLQPVRKDKYYTMGIIPHEGHGYILYHVGLPQGTFRLSGFSGHDCVVAFFLCDAGTIYDLPSQGSTGGVVVKKPGLYFMGGYQYKHVKTKFWEGGKYDLEKTDRHPSQVTMLKAVHERLATRHPDAVKRLEAFLASQGGQ